MFDDAVSHGEVPELGIFSMTLAEAGELVARCLWFDGKIKADIPELEEDEYYSLFDPRLKAPLKEESLRTTALFVNAAEKGTLKTSVIFRRLDESVIAESTYVDWGALDRWLQERNIHLGDAIGEYTDIEMNVWIEAVDFVKDERAKRKLPFEERKKFKDDPKESWSLRIQIAELQEQIVSLKGVTENVKPISEKQRGAYLNIIAALLGVILGKSSGGKAYSQFSSQQAVIDIIHATYGEKNGLSKRNLEEKFSLAKRNLEGSLTE